MKKLRLNHDDLRVESFGTEPGTQKRGTVMGQSGWATCDYWGTCSPSGQHTCYNTGCQSGLSTICESEGVTDCPGYDTCDPASYDGGFTCHQSCTDIEACSFCGAMC
jgi:hypothetical protein